MWDNIKEIIGTMSPVLGGMIGGPVGATVGTLIAKTLGVEDNPKAIEEALKNNPDALVKLRELENTKEIAILQMELETKKLGVNSILEDKRMNNDRNRDFLSDVQNARTMQIENLKQDDKFSKRFIYVLAAFWSVFSAVYIILITFGTIPTANIRFADTILGFILGTIIATIINFFLGTSDKSGEKDLPLEIQKAIEEFKIKQKEDEELKKLRKEVKL